MVDDIVLKQVGVGGDGTAVSADVLFIHGLTGDAESWSALPDQAGWPDWFAENPAHSVWVLEYPADATRWTSEGPGMDLVERAMSIAGHLAASDLFRRPTFWICHSLGGVLAKQVLRQSVELGVPELERIAAHTAGVAFLASPHSGSTLARLADALPGIRPKAITKALRADAPLLRDLGTWYSNNSESLGIATIAFYETQTLKGTIVVAPTSADPHVRSSLFLPVDADHFSIAKPSAIDAPVPAAVSAFIRNKLRGTEELHLDLDETPGLDEAARLAWPRKTIHAMESLEELSRVFAAIEREWLTASLKARLRGVLTELAMNAFEHAQASWCEVAVYEESIVFQAPGAEFDPIKATPTFSGGRLGAGLFAFHELLKDYRDILDVQFRWHDTHDGSGVNEVLLYVLDPPPMVRDEETGFSEITIRQPTLERRVSPRGLSHIVRLVPGESEYVLDWERMQVQLLADLLSVRVQLLYLVIERLPLAARLYVRLPADDLMRRYLRESPELASRIVVMAEQAG